MIYKNRFIEKKNRRSGTAYIYIIPQYHFPPLKMFDFKPK